MPGELDGVGFVANRVDNFETNTGADGATDELSAGVWRFANGGFVVDFLNQDTSGKTSVERGRSGKDVGNQQHFGLFIDVEGSADAGDLKGHLREIILRKWKTLKNGPADTR